MAEQLMGTLNIPHSGEASGLAISSRASIASTRAAYPGLKTGECHHEQAAQVLKRTTPQGTQGQQRRNRCAA